MSAAKRAASPPTHVALLRAINVGGHVVTMERLRELFAALGHAGIETFIASGNVAFAAARPAREEHEIADELEAHLASSLGWEVATFLRTPAELTAPAAHRAFIEDAGGGADGPKESEYVAFLKAPPPPDGWERLLAFPSDVDTFALHGRDLHWRVRGSALDSKLSGNKLEKLLGAPLTVRNVTTVRKVAGKWGAAGR